MAHRVRSRTAESTENKKTKVTPRRLTEKIAIMRRREHEQSEAFQKAMRSIFEMQQAQQARANSSSIHSGGGSMPSLAAIDSQPLLPSIDMQSVFNDLNEVTMRSSPSTTSSRERPHSGGPTGRRSQFDKRTQSCDTDPYPTSIGAGQHHYLHQPGTEWMEGDLSRHKSDSDLQQSLLAQQQGPQMLNQQFPPLVHPQFSSSSGAAPPTPPSSLLSTKSAQMTQNDLGMWGKQKRPASISTATSLLSPDTAPHAYQNTLSAPGTGTASSSLPDLTNIEFQSGLDVPLERDDSVPQLQPLLQPQQPSLQQQQQQQQQSMIPPYQSLPTPPGGYQSSNLLVNSFQANQQQQQQHLQQQQQQQPPLSNTYITSHAYVHQPLVPNTPHSNANHHRPSNHQPSLLPLHQYHPLSKNIPALNLNPSSNYRPSQFNSMMSSHMPPFCGTMAGPKGMGYNSASGVLAGHQNRTSTTAYQPLHPLLPSLLNPNSSSNRGPSYPGVTLRGALQSSSASNINGALPPTMNIVIQPPRPVASSSPSSAGVLSASAPNQPVPTPPFSPPHSSLPAQSPLSLVQSPPPLTSTPPLANESTNQIPGGLCTSSGDHSPRAQFPISSMNSLPATPTITISPGFSALPSYLAARQQQDLQEKFASFGMHKTEHLVRSHSEENLQQKIQKERGDLMHNPFMGNLANANSVPCVYVDSPSNENIAEACDSPNTGDSPSTSASYASSPPSVRPFWIDQQQANDFVFHGHEWPMMEGGGGPGGGPGGGGPGGGGTTTGPGIPPTDKPTKPGSPIYHHKSLTDLNVLGDLAEPSPRTNRGLQLSLPSIVMSDLAMDEQVEKLGSPVVFNDYSVEESVMDTLLKQEELSGLHSFDMGFLTSDILMSGSPDSLLHKNVQF